jgi:hypothetical protein
MSADDQPQSGAAPPATAANELRITSGVHQGARITLPGGSAPADGARLSVGPGLDHDVVLSDAPGSAELVCSNGQWQWREADFESDLGTTGAWRWGSLILAIAPAQSGWVAQPKLLFDRQPSQAANTPASSESASGAASGGGPGPVSAASEDTAHEGATPDPSAAANGASGDRGIDDSPVAGSPARHRRWAAAAIASAAFIAIGLAVVLGLRSTPDSDQSAGANAPQDASAASNAVDPAAVRTALAQAGLMDRVRVIPLNDGRLRLVGVVADDDELDRMVAAVRRVTRRVVQGVLTQREFVQRVADLQRETPQAVRMRPAPIGRVLLVDTENARFDLSAFKAWLAKALPEALEVLVVERARLAEIEAMPFAAGAARPEGAPAAAFIAPAPAPVTAIPVLPEVPAEEPPLPELPDIRLVVSGAQPYVMLGSGEKWLPGGRVGGWYLTAIEARTLVLEDVRGRRVSSPR